MANSPIFVTQPGIGYGPINSLTSLTVGTGTQTLTVPSNLAYTAGAWVTIFNTGGAWMYGMVTNYITTVLSVNVTLTSGSGTFSAWSVNLAGAPGALTPWASNINGAGFALTSWADKGGQVYNARAFNVKCDGTTDDTAAFNAAIAAVPAGATLYLPSGTTTLISSPLLVHRGGITLTSDGLWPAAIQATVANIDLIEVGDNTTQYNAIGISNLALYPKSGTVGSSGYAINAQFCSFVNIDHVYIGGGGFLWRGVNFLDCLFSEITNRCHMQAVVDRMVSISGTVSRGTTDVTVQNSRIAVSGTDGVWIGDYAWGLWVANMEIYSSASSTVGWAVNLGSKAVASGDLFIQDNEIECAIGAGDFGGLNLNQVGARLKVTGNSIAQNNGTSGGRIAVAMSSSVSDVLFTGNVVQAGNSTSECLFSSATTTVISGNKFEGLGACLTLVRLFAGGPYTVSGNGFSGAVSFDLEIDSGVSTVIEGNTMPDSARINWNGDPTATVLGHNRGISDQLQAVANASSITIPVNPVIEITGTGAITTMAGWWYGRQVDLWFQSGGSVATGGSGLGQFLVSKTVAAGGILHCTYINGSGWTASN